MSREDKITILIRDVPGDVARELDRRARNNYRSRVGEVLAILTAYCRGGATLPGLAVGESVQTAEGVAKNGDAQDGDAQDYDAQDGDAAEGGEKDGDEKGEGADCAGGEA